MAVTNGNGGSPQFQRPVPRPDEVASPDEQALLEVDGLDDEQEPDEDGMTVTENPDGTATITYAKEPEAEATDFWENLAETMDMAAKGSLSVELLKLIDLDKKAREKRDKQYEEGLKRTGLGNDAPGGADFEGASKVVHPVMAEGCVDFQARVSKELFPAEGPVKPKIVQNEEGPTQEQLDRADRKARHMNWQLTTQIKEFRPETEQLLTQLPLGGSQYLKVWHDRRLKRPITQFVPIDYVLLPFAASNYWNAERRTHEMNLTALEFKQRVDSGWYLPLSGSEDGAKQPGGSILPVPTGTQEANEKIEGKEDPGQNEDGIRLVHESDCWWDLAECDPQAKGETRPYLITIDDQSREVVGIYRNWDPDKKVVEAMPHMAEDVFIPWRGAYGIGFPQLIGGLSAALTGALRALLDSAHINNIPSLVKLKGIGVTGQSKQINATQVTEIDAPVNMDDIRKIMMAVPFNQPSVVLFQLLGFLTETSKGVVRTSIDIPEFDPRQAVGTSLALIEQGLVVFSSIYQRQFEFLRQVLLILHRLNKMYLDEEVVLEEVGNLRIHREDYAGPLDVEPTADPRIFSEAQRVGQAQTLMQLAEKYPAAFKPLAVIKRFLTTMKIPNIDEVINDPKPPPDQNPVANNIQLMMGAPVAAYPNQDHLAGIQVTLDMLMNPNLGSSPLFAATVLAPGISLVKQHVTFLYADSMIKALEQASGIDLNEAMKNPSPQTKELLAKAFAAASPHVTKELDKALAKVTEAIGKLIPIMKQYQPPAPMDPSQAALQAAAAETQRKTAADQAKAQKDQADLQLKAQQDQKDRETEAARLQTEQAQLALDQEDAARRAQAENIRTQLDAEANQLDNETSQTNNELDAQVDLTINEQDNTTAKQIAAAEIASGQNTDLSTGGGINPGS